MSAKKVQTTKLEHLDKTPLLTNDDEDETGIMYVFQTKIDKNTIHERMRSPMGMWKKEEKYINNDIQSVIDRMNAYYA